MKYDPLVFPIVPPRDGAFSHHLEVGTFPSEFISPSISGPFLRDYDYLGCPREVVDFFKTDIVDFAYVLFQFQCYCAHPLGLYEIPILLTYELSPLSMGFYSV